MNFLLELKTSSQCRGVRFTSRKNLYFPLISLIFLKLAPLDKRICWMRMKSVCRTWNSLSNWLLVTYRCITTDSNNEQVYDLSLSFVQDVSRYCIRHFAHSFLLCVSNFVIEQDRYVACLLHLCTFCNHICVFIWVSENVGEWSLWNLTKVWAYLA